MASLSPAASVVVVGSVNCDITVVTDELPEPGQTVTGRSVTLAQGGKGANQAIAAARAGAAVTLIGAVGDDDFAEVPVGALRDAGIDVDSLRRTTGPTGLATVTVAASGENSIVVIPGANAHLTELRRSELDAVATADVLSLQLEIPMSGVLAAAEHAHAHGTTVVLNPSPVTELPSSLLEVVDILVVNRGEAARLAVETLPPRMVVVTTLGSDGVRVIHAASDTDASIAAPAVDTVDTTGAGDVFAGTLCARLPDGLVDAVAFANAAAALSTTRPGAGSSAPSAQDVSVITHRT
ncbi:PfkB family carbohydrate kinase [Williamsia sterculiae]|uniref:Ribokinase n=1 Tax=Williamsia sterculiae TaxID=1344003 RepID=A0A1N7GJG5_9NOCA|nr:PfkB family carbohydrate kinase [Williamsia sterculiae]SIS12666.1 ribokinase [Williamsia sterculiae]